jgi:penicillin-binding protein 1B
LAGLIRSPGNYSPFKNLAQAYDRRNFVLKMMLEKNLIANDDYRVARKEKIVVPPGPSVPLGAPFFVSYLQSVLKENYGDLLASEGLRIFTTLNAQTQELAERVLRQRLASYESTRPTIKLEKEKGRSLEGLLVAIDPQTGYIRAYVGGREFGQSQFDRVSMARRQPGSAFKPFVYAAALRKKEKWTLSSLVEDMNLTVESGGEPWSPQNYDEKEHGLVTLREALEQSYNLATARLALAVGLDEVIKLARDAGIESPLDPVPALALGAFEVTPLELLRSYTIFPNNGLRAEPVVFTNLVTRDGTVLERKSFKMKKVISHELAYLINAALTGVLDRGTGRSARALGFKEGAAGKTGTTTEYRDSWFVGYTPDLLTLVWVGYDDQVVSGLTGASGALPIWADFMRGTVKPESRDFEATEDIVLVEIDRATGKRFKRGCSEMFQEVFIRGTEPKEKCR